MKKNFLIIAVFAALMALGFNAPTAFAQGSVIGQVIDADNNPVEGAHVELQQIIHERGQRPFRAQAQTNERGIFEFPRVLAGDYVIHAGTRELGMAREEIEVVDDEVTRIRLQLEGRRGGDDDEERGVGAVIGIVLTPDGDPFEGAAITMTPMQRQRGERVRPYRARSDENGQFVFLEVPEGMYIVQASVRGAGARARLEVVADQRNRVELVLQRIGRRGDDGEGGRHNGGRIWRHMD